MPSYYPRRYTRKAYKKKSLTNWATSNRTSTAPPSRRQYGAASNSRTSQGYSRQAYRPRMVQQSATASIPFMTQLRLMEQHNHMVTTSSAEQTVPTSDIKSTTVMSQSPSQTQTSQTQIQPSVQQSLLDPHPPSALLAQTSSVSMRLRSGQPAI